MNFKSLTLALLATTLAIGTASTAKATPMDRFLKQELVAGSAYYVDVLVRYKGDIQPADKARIQGIGGYVYRNLNFIDTLAVRVPRKSLAKLSGNPRVASLSADVAVQKTDSFTVGHTGADIANVAYGLSGTGVGVAVIDSGVRLHDDFTKPSGSGFRVVQKNFTGSKSADDLCGHGTHVAGIIAGNGKRSTGGFYTQTFLGVAPQSSIVGVKVLDNNGSGTVSNVVAGIQWAIANKATYNIRVMNLSLGHSVGESYKTDPLCQAVESAWKAGIVVVCAAGNNGRLNATQAPGQPNEGYGTAYGSIQSPGNDPYVITVGAMKNGFGVRNLDQVATYSSRGPSRYDFVMKPDILAPGNKVVSTNAASGYLETTFFATNIIPWQEYRTVPKSSDSKTYFRLSGTSMAAPVVAGAAALLIQQDPSVSPDTVKARLMISADKWGDPQGNADVLTYGAGYLNIPAALAATNISLSAPALTPSLTQTSDGWVMLDPNALTMSAGRNIIWGTAGFSPNIIWGTAGFAPNIIWGTSDYALSNSHIIWGTGLWTNLTTNPISSSSVDLSSTAINGE